MSDTDHRVFEADVATEGGDLLVAALPHHSRAEPGGDGTVVQESLKNLLTSRDLRGHDEWACRLGHEKGRMTSVALRKRTRSNSPCPSLRTPRQMFADPTVVETVVKPEGIGAK